MSENTETAILAGGCFWPAQEPLRHRDGGISTRAGVGVTPIDDSPGRRAGMLLARTGHAGATDAAAVCLAADGDDILASDPGDLRVLAEPADVHVELVLV